jgi:hypothetical protein
VALMVPGWPDAVTNQTAASGAEDRQSCVGSPLGGGSRGMVFLLYTLSRPRETALMTSVIAECQGVVLRGRLDVGGLPSTWSTGATTQRRLPEFQPSLGL